MAEAMAAGQPHDATTPLINTIVSTFLEFLWCELDCVEAPHYAPLPQPPRPPPLPTFHVCVCVCLVSSFCVKRHRALYALFVYLCLFTSTMRLLFRLRV